MNTTLTPLRKAKGVALVLTALRAVGIRVAIHHITLDRPRRCALIGGLLRESPYGTGADCLESYPISSWINY